MQSENCNPIKDSSGLWCEFPEFNWAPLSASESEETTLEVLERAAKIKPLI